MNASIKIIFILFVFFLLGDLPTMAQTVTMTPEALQGFSLYSVLRGIIGIIAITGIAFLMSKNRRKIAWKTIGLALLCQIVLALGVLYIPTIQLLFEGIARIFVSTMQFSQVGMRFLVGDLANSQKMGHIFLFQVLPNIIFFATLTSILYYLNILQRIVTGIGWCLKKIFRISGAEGLTLGGNIFLGLVETPLLIKQYLPRMNRSQLFLIMSSGMATIAGGVMSAYISMLGGDSPEQRILFAQYLISASVMAMPGVIVIAKIMVPQTETTTDAVETEKDNTADNLIEAIANGAYQGLRLAGSVAAILLVIISLVALLNYILGDIIGQYSGLNELLSQWHNAPTQFTFQYILGIIFTPIAWLMGVCNDDIFQIGSLLGTKLTLNEFVAFADFTALKNAGGFMQEKSIVMATFLLCGFANLGSVGMIIGGLCPLAPNKKKWITQFGIPSMVCGALVSCLSATIVGMILG